MPTEVSPTEHMMRNPGSLQLDPSGEGVAIDETKRLIASNKVEGTPVYKRDGEQLGLCHRSGQGALEECASLRRRRRTIRGSCLRTAPRRLLWRVLSV
jgi:hypothetical protein